MAGSLRAPSTFYGSVSNVTGAAEFRPWKTMASYMTKPWETMALNSGGQYFFPFVSMSRKWRKLFRTCGATSDAWRDFSLNENKTPYTGNFIVRRFNYEDFVSTDWIVVMFLPLLYIQLFRSFFFSKFISNESPQFSYNRLPYNAVSILWNMKHDDDEYERFPSMTQNDMNTVLRMTIVMPIVIAMMID